MNTTEWKRILIDGEETKYYISNTGKVYSTISNKILSPGVSFDNYEFVTLVHNGKKYEKRVHVLVAEAFIPNPENKTTVNHILAGRENKRLNTVENLEWATPKEQYDHAMRNNMIHPKRGSESHYSKINEDIAHKICKLLEANKPYGYISDRLNVSASTIKHISNGRSWRHISTQYNIKKDERRRSVVSDKLVAPNGMTYDIAYSILEMKDSGMTYKQIKDTIPIDVSKDMVREICRGRSWKNVYEDYQNSKKYLVIDCNLDEYGE